MDFLRNYSLEEAVKVIKRTQKGSIYRQVKKIILVDQVEEEKIEIVGFDYQWNLVKVYVNLADETK